MSMIPLPQKEIKYLKSILNYLELYEKKHPGVKEIEVDLPLKIMYYDIKLTKKAILLHLKLKEYDPTSWRYKEFAPLYNFFIDGGI